MMCVACLAGSCMDTVSRTQLLFYELRAQCANNFEPALRGSHVHADVLLEAIAMLSVSIAAHAALCQSSIGLVLATPSLIRCMT